MAKPPEVNFFQKNIFFTIYEICLYPHTKTKSCKSSRNVRNGARGLQRLPCLKYYNVLKQESKFI